MEERRKRKKKISPTIGIYVLVLIVLYIAIYIIPSVSGALVSTYNISYGELRLSDTTEGYFVRKESVYVAGHGGETSYYLKENELIRKGTTVMKITGASDAEVAEEQQVLLDRLGGRTITTDYFKSRKEGILSFYADGYEKQLSPSTMGKLDYDFYRNLKQEDVVDLNRDNVVSGEPVYKVVDRSKWYIVCFVPEKSKVRYDIGKTVSLELDDKVIKARVFDVKELDGNVRVIFKTDYYYENFGKIRVAENLNIVSYANRGLLVENHSITTVNKQEGVYVKNKSGEINFVPIKVIKSDEEISLVCDTRFYDSKGKEVKTVEIYDEVLKNPRNAPKQ